MQLKPPTSTMLRLLLVALLVGSALAACPTNVCTTTSYAFDTIVCNPRDSSLNYPNISGQSPACNYAPVPMAQWTQTAVSTDSASFPLGFRKGTFYEENNPSFGVRVPNSQSMKIQLIVETMQPEAMVCVRDLSPMFNMAARGAVNQCASQRLIACFDASSVTNYTDFVLYCNQGCRSAQTDFWYRIVVSSTSWTNPTDANGNSIEDWCDMQMALNTTMFPSQLAPAVPVGFSFVDTSNPANVYNPNSATQHSVMLALFAGFVALLAL